MAFTIDVARSAGVSPSTVSLVVNRKGRISIHTRRRVQEAIKRLGYARQPRLAMARRAAEVALIYGRDAVLDGTVSLLTRQVIAGVRQRLTVRHGHMSLFQGQSHIRTDQLLRERLKAGDIDGVILISPNRREGYLQYLVRTGKPLVVLNRQPQFNEFSAVSIDYYHGGRLAIEHLFSLGHERIALAFASRRYWPTRALLGGVAAVMREHKRQPATLLTIDQRAVMEELVQRALSSGATALFTSDYVASRLLPIFQARGVQTPGDLSVVGFDDWGIKTPTGLPLTTIGYDKKRLGRLAVSLVLKLARGKDRGHASPTGLRHFSVSVPVRLIQGGTTAPPKSVSMIG